MKLRHTLRNPTFLYIIKEDGDKHSKIGICSSQLWERLRKLQQGNPNDLRMEYLWLGNESDVKYVERCIKLEHCYYKSEWSGYSADELRKKVQELADTHGLVDLITTNVLPYTAKTGNSCDFRTKRVEYFYNAARLFPDESVYVSNTGTIYEYETWTKLWPLEEEAA